MGQEATVETLYGQPTGSELRKENDEAVYCHPVYLTYTQSTSCYMSAGLDELQAGIKIVRSNTNNLRYADDTTLMAESKRN